MLWKIIPFMTSKYEITLSQQQVSQPSKPEEALSTSGNEIQPATAEGAAVGGSAKRIFVGIGKGQGVIRDLPKKKRKKKKESSNMAKLRKKYASRRRMGPRTWDEAKRRFWREWADRRSRRAQRWTVSRVAPSRGLIVGGVKSWKQKENLEIVELELCIVDHANI